MNKWTVYFFTLLVCFGLVVLGGYFIYWGIAAPNYETAAMVQLAAPTVPPQVEPPVDWCKVWTIELDGVQYTFDLVEGESDDRLMDLPYHFGLVLCEWGKIKIIENTACDNCRANSIEWGDDGSYDCVSVVTKTPFHGLPAAQWWPQGEPEEVEQ